MLSARRLAWFLVFAVYAAVLSSAVCSAPNDIKIGVVDITRVRKTAPRLQQYDAEFAKIQTELQSELDYRSTHLLLDEAKLKQYIALKQKGQAATAADIAAIKALDDEDNQLATELKTIQNTPDASMTDALRARQKDLAAIVQKNKTTADQFIKDSQLILQGKGDELSKKIEDDIIGAVKEAAVAKQFGYVYDKGALLYGGTDLTDEVIKRLPSKS